MKVELTDVLIKKVYFSEKNKQTNKPYFPCYVKNWNLEQLFSLIPFVNKNNMTDLTTEEQYSWYVLVIAFMIR